MFSNNQQGFQKLIEENDQSKNLRSAESKRLLEEGLRMLERA